MMGASRPPSHDASPPPRFQFGLRSLFVLTAVCAVILASTAPLETSFVFRLVVAFYFILLAGYAVLRLPSIVARIRWSLRRRDELRAERRRFLNDRAQAHAPRPPGSRDGTADDDPLG